MYFSYGTVVQQYLRDFGSADESVARFGLQAIGHLAGSGLSAGAIDGDAIKTRLGEAGCCESKPSSARPLNIH